MINFFWDKSNPWEIFLMDTLKVVFSLFWKFFKKKSENLFSKSIIKFYIKINTIPSFLIKSTGTIKVQFWQPFWKVWPEIINFFAPKLNIFTDLSFNQKQLQFKFYLWTLRANIINKSADNFSRKTAILNQSPGETMKIRFFSKKLLSLKV